MKILKMVFFVTLWIAIGVNKAMVGENEEGSGDHFSEEENFANFQQMLLASLPKKSERFHEPSNFVNPNAQTCWEYLNTSVPEKEIDRLLEFPNKNMSFWIKRNFAKEMNRIIAKNKGLVGSTQMMKKWRPECKSVFKKHWRKEFGKFFNFLNAEDFTTLKASISYTNVESGFMQTIGVIMAEYVRERHVESLKTASSRIGKMCDIFYQNVLAKEYYQKFKHVQKLTYYRSSFEYLMDRKSVPSELEGIVGVAIQFCQRIEEISNLHPETEHNEQLMLGSLLRALKRFNETSEFVKSNSNMTIGLEEYLEYLAQYFQNDNGIEKKEVASTVLKFCQKHLARRLRRTDYSCTSGEKIDLVNLVNSANCKTYTSHWILFEAFGKSYSNPIKLFQPACEMSLKIRCSEFSESQLDMKWDPNVEFFRNLPSKNVTQKYFDDARFDFISLIEPSQYYSHFA